MNILNLPSWEVTGHTAFQIAKFHNLHGASPGAPCVQEAEVTHMAITFKGVEAKRGEVILLRPSDIQRDEKNRGRPFGTDSEQVAAMEQSLEQEGQKQPIIIRKTADGLPCLVAGYTRHEAGLQIEKRNPEFRLRCVVENGNEDEAFRSAIIENAQRNDLSDMQHALNHEELRRRGIVTTDAEIAKLYGRNPAWVSRLKKLLLLPTSVQQQVHRGEISAHAGRLLAEFDAEEQRELIANGRANVTELEEQLRQRTPAPPVKAVLAPVLQPDTTDAAPLDFGTATSDSKPNSKTRQRSLPQVKALLHHYTTDDTHPVIRMFSNAVLAYIAGSLDETEYELLVCEVEGRDKKTAVPAKKRGAK